MKALQDRGVTREGVITCLYKRIKNMADGQKQYKDAKAEEVKELKKKLEEEGCQKKKEQEAKETAEKEWAALFS